MISTRLHQFSDEGTVTVEYAIATVAAGLLAAILIAVANSDEISSAITDLVRKALTPF